jgi:hypothetical protein
MLCSISETEKNITRTSLQALFDRRLDWDDLEAGSPSAVVDASATDAAGL